MSQDQELDEDLDSPPPIGLSSRELAINLAIELRGMREREEETGEHMDDQTVLVMIAAAIDANNRQIYKDLCEYGVIVEEEAELEDGEAE